MGEWTKLVLVTQLNLVPKRIGPNYPRKEDGKWRNAIITSISQFCMEPDCRLGELDFDQPPNANKYRIHRAAELVRVLFVSTLSSCSLSIINSGFLQKFCLSSVFNMLNKHSYCISTYYKYYVKKLDSGSWGRGFDSRRGLAHDTWVVGEGFPAVDTALHPSQGGR